MEKITPASVIDRFIFLLALFLVAPKVSLQAHPTLMQSGQVTEQPAVYPGGKVTLNKFLASIILLPEISFQHVEPDSLIGMSSLLILKINAQGRATLDSVNSFTTLSTIPDKPEVRRAAWKIYKQAVAKMPLWHPAIQNGRPVATTDTAGYGQTITATSYKDYLKLRQEDLANPGDTIHTENLKTKAGTPVYTFMEKPPVFPGGFSGLKDYLENNSVFTVGPSNISFNEMEIVWIIINEAGVVEDIKIEKSQGAQADAEAIKVLIAMPKWQPAKQKNKYVAAALPLFLRFK